MTSPVAGTPGETRESPSDEAVELAAREWASDPIIDEATGETDHDRFRSGARAALAAVWPLLVRQVRETVADEIEAVRAAGPPSSWQTYYFDGIRRAARIARGETLPAEPSRRSRPVEQLVESTASRLPNVPSR